MKVQQSKDGHDVKITFVPENEEEKRIMGSLRNHFFYGMPEKKTYPDYDGVTTENNFVTSLSLKFKKFKREKCIKLTKLAAKLQFVKAIKEVTGKSLLESKNIADSIAIPNGVSGYKYGTLLLNESSITPEQWEEITRHPAFRDARVEFEYV